MINGLSVLALIPAREGSKRCPEKNWTIYTNKLTGEARGLIEWAIKHARGSKYIDTIAVSSDSDLILNYAKPPIIPIRRPAHLASDHATSEAVIVHALYSLSSLGEHQIPPHDLLVLLQPTSPLRLSSDIDSCLELAISSGQAITSTDPHHRLNGAVYVSYTLKFLSSLRFGGSQHFIMPAERSLDIDQPQDFSL